MLQALCDSHVRLVEEHVEADSDVRLHDTPLEWLCAFAHANTAKDGIPSHIIHTGVKPRFYQ